IAGVSGSGTTYTVTVNTGTGTGTLQLNLVDDDSIRDANGNPLNGTGVGNGNFTGQVYQMRPPDFLDPSFEFPSVGAGNLQHNPTNPAWPFTPLTTSPYVAVSGVAANGSSFTKNNPAAPQGAQVAYIVGTASITQTVNPGAGNYYLTFDAAQSGS